jgi:hypothetical protein
MLKKAASYVLAALRGSTYGTKYAFASSLAVASLDCLFEHPASRSPQRLTAFTILDYKTWHASRTPRGA